MEPRIVTKEQYDNMTSKEVCGEAWTGPEVTEDKGTQGTIELNDGRIHHPICNVVTSEVATDPDSIRIDKTWYEGAGHDSTVEHYFSAGNSYSNESPLTRLSDLLASNPSIKKVSTRLQEYIIEQQQLWNNRSEC